MHVYVCPSVYASGIYGNRKQFSVQLHVKKRMVFSKQDQHMDSMKLEHLLRGNADNHLHIYKILGPTQTQGAGVDELASE